MNTINKLIDTLPTIVKQNMTKIAVLITVIISIIYILVFANHYSICKAAEEASIRAFGYYKGTPFSDTLYSYMPLLVISIILIIVVWIAESLIKKRYLEQGK